MEAAACRIGRAAERRSDLGVGQIAGVAQRHGGALLRRQRRDDGPDSIVARKVDGPGFLRDLGDRQRTAPACAVVIDRLAVRDRQQPAAQVAVVVQLRIGAQRRQEGLLEAVIGIGAADGAAQHGHHVPGVLVEEGLERGQGGHVMD